MRRSRKASRAYCKGDIMKQLVALLALLCFALPAFTAPASADTRINNPTVNQRPLDWCLNPAQDCGKPAAERYCQLRNLGHVVKVAGQRSDRPTYILGTKEICTQPRFDHCDRFSWIVCSAVKID